MSADANSTYAPKSPDLSSFYSGSPTQAAPQLQPQSHGQAGYKLQPPTYGYTSSYAAPSSYTPAYGAPPASGPAPDQPAVHPEFETSFYSPPAQHHHGTLPPSGPVYVLHPPTIQPLPYEHPPFTDPALYLAPGPPQDHLPAYPPTSHPYPQALSPNMPPRKAAVPPPPAPVIEPSPVRTKFPTARIKRIMQADEEVGKVAQQTPIAVGKALELFMIQLVTKSADVAREKGTKRVTASMLKQVVETDEQWDFLRDIVSKVENEKEGSKAKAKPESETDEEMEEPKKRGRGGRRKKTA